MNFPQASSAATSDQVAWLTGLVGAVYLSKITGGPVSDEEARNVLGRFGAIEETCPTTVADQQMHGLPEGIWVKFVFFMDCKDAIAVSYHLVKPISTF